MPPSGLGSRVLKEGGLELCNLEKMNTTVIKIVVEAGAKPRKLYGQGTQRKYQSREGT